MQREAEEKEMSERAAASNGDAPSKGLEAAAKDMEDIDESEAPEKEMLTREQRAVLLKQGYAVVGSHR